MELNHIDDEGAETLMFPPDWLQAAQRRAAELSCLRRMAVALGVDPAEGGDWTVWCLVDELGVIAWRRERTPDVRRVRRRLAELPRPRAAADAAEAQARQL